ncbi:MAG: amidohydrolase family protein [Bradymonadaceae bacterium]
MIIDIHTHLMGVDEDNGCYVGPSMRGGLVYTFLKRTLGLGDVDRDGLDAAYRDKLIEWAEESDLDAAGVLALDGIYDEEGQLDREATTVLIGNDYCLEVCEQSDALLPICSVNPARHDALEELERVVEAGSVAVKLLPNSQGVDPGRPIYQPFWRRMAELGVPLLTHASFEHTIPVVDQIYGDPERLRPVLDEGVTVIAAHCASSGVAHITEHIGTWMEMLRAYPNLYGDISAMASLARFPYLTQVLDDEVARERIALGSDFPIPVTPWLFIRELGWSTARRLSRIENPLQKNLETFRAMGCGQAIVRRRSRLLRLQ